ncbi:MAG: Uma2 family endonuclease [Planctomycetes bacterium]|nr:Uma2 family endonuclease [Planctomycetota bacterium]
MVTRTREKLLTAEGFMDRLDEFWPAELIAGRVVRIDEETWIMANGGEHGLVRQNVGAAIHVFLAKNPIGFVFQNSGTKTKSHPDQVRFPDVAYFSRKRLPEGKIPRKNFPVVPDLAIEVVSPSDKWPRLLARVEEFLAGGTKSCWVVDPESRRVTIFRQGTEAKHLRPGDKLSKDPALPGFSVDVAEFFAGL